MVVVPLVSHLARLHRGLDLGTPPGLRETRELAKRDGSLRTRRDDRREGRDAGGEIGGEGGRREERADCLVINRPVSLGKIERGETRVVSTGRHGDQNGNGEVVRPKRVKSGPRAEVSQSDWGDRNVG